MNRKLEILVALLATALSLGCSLLKDLSADQCQVDSDCQRFGNYACDVAQKVCVPDETNTGGTNGTGGSETGGEGGAPAPPECTTNAECIAANNGAPFICNNNSCVSLTLEGHCPYVVAGTDQGSTENLTKPGAPIIFGAYVPIDVAAPETHPYTLNFRFAIEEFLLSSLGGVVGPGGVRRPFVMVLCQATDPDLEASSDFLVNTLEVPAILSTLTSRNLSTAFDLANASGRKVFFLGALEADDALARLGDDSRMWHMLGPATDLVPAYGPLLKSVEKYAIEQMGKIPPLKVAIVYNDLTFSNDMANALPDVVEINGSKLNSSANQPYYSRHQVKVVNVITPDVSKVVTDLKPLATGPDIIISVGSKEFINPIIDGIQNNLNGATGRGPSPENAPFYVLSPAHPFNNDLTSGSFFSSKSYMIDLDLVMAGVNYASVEDDSLYQQYLAAIQARFDGTPGLESRENLYDAAYFMMYSLASAALTITDFNGDDVASGMRNLVRPEGEPAQVGPDDVSSVLSSLLQGESIALTGTLGPPDFNLTTGARKSPGSIWCVDKPGTVRFDVLRLVPVTPPAVPTAFKLADGDEFCFPNFFPAP